MGRKTLWAATAVAGLALATFAGKALAHDEPVAGSLIGAAIGSTVAHDSDHGRHVRRDARHYSRAHIERVRDERAVYVAPTRYDEPAPHGTPRARYVADTVTLAPQARYVPAARYEANGSSAHCGPQKSVRKVAAKPKVKKVCRYVAVR